VLQPRSLDLEVSSSSAALPEECDELDRRVLAHSLTNSEAMRRFASGKATRAVALALAREYYPVCVEFPLFLAAAISHVRDESARLLLVANLYEEHGDLDPTRTHPALFRSYIRSLGLDPQGLGTAGDGAPGVRLARRFRAVCREGPDSRAVAMLYAFESLFSPACRMVAEGLRRMGHAEAGIEFFDVHAVADLAHAEQLRSSLRTACRSDDEWAHAIEIADEGAQLLYTLFDAVASVSS
jgi:pyrroloquinoline-quinone synthase